jgi:hypothetical protein
MHLLKTTTEMKACYGRLNVNTAFESFASFVADAQDKYIVPLIGQDAVDALQEWYDAYTDGEEEQDIANLKLLKQVQRPLTFYTLLEAAPGMILDMGDNGLVETMADNTTGARQWTVNKLELYLSENADTFAESLLSFLEKFKADYAFWDESDFRKAARKLFIDSGSRLTDHIKISQPRRFFLSMLQSINRVESLSIPVITGQELFDDLKTKMEDGTLSEEEETLVAKIRPLVAYLAMADVLPQIAISITSSGIKVLSENEGIKNAQAADPNLVNGQVQYNLSMAAKYEGILRNFLNDNATDYELFPVPETDNSDTSRPQWSDNATKKSFRFP